MTLAGRCFALMRPAAQCEALAGLLEAEGAQALRVPLLDIQPLPDTTALRALTPRLADYHLAFFVSPNAVTHALAIIPRAQWPASLQIATVGPGSAAALAQQGFSDVIVPQRQFDSEAVLALPEFAENAVRDRRILVLRGEGGRELLADTLRTRGATVDTLACYRRSAAPVDVAPLLARHAAGQLDGLIITSSEAVGVLTEAHLGAQLLADCCAFVPHPRIAASAKECGARQIVLTGPGDAGIVKGILTHFEGGQS